MAQILRNMKHPPVEEATTGDKEEYQRKRKEIVKKFGVKSCSALKDEKERKACYAALDAAHVSDDEEDEDDDPVGKNEEVEIDEMSNRAKMIIVDDGLGLVKKMHMDIVQEWKEMVMEKINSLITKYRERFKWKDHVLYVEKGIEKDVTSLIKKGGLTATVKVSSNPMREEVEIDEADKKYPPTIETLKMIVKDKQNQVVKFKDGNARVDGYSASAMTQVYDAMKKPDLKKNFEKMIETKAGFLKIQAFAFSMVK